MEKTAVSALLNAIRPSTARSFKICGKINAKLKAALKDAIPVFKNKAVSIILLPGYVL
jgi:hypothetical protein